jgi:hypothetical protein
MLCGNRSHEQRHSDSKEIGEAKVERDIGVFPDTTTHIPPLWQAMARPFSGTYFDT